MKNRNIINEIKTLNRTDIKLKVKNLNEQLAKLKMYHAVVPLKNPLYIKNLRKTIARIKTYLKQM
ncbi:MAG: 50S ribosomal protein L29 [Endomicrobium sp.]|jgi:large subunit ribosomal protein L29|nr:50S ribosomal protein L29 [Endomicrobium sp.]